MQREAISSILEKDALMSLKAKKYFVKTSLIFSLFLLWSVAGYGQQEKVRTGGTLRVRTFFQGLVPSLDPVQPDCDLIILDQIFEGLIRFNSSLQIVPELADYWVISPEGTKYTFYLRKNVRFHHGRPLTAADVKASLERLIKPGNGPFYSYFISKVRGAKEFYEGREARVKGFSARDDHVFEVELLEPNPSLLSVLAAPFCKIFPQDLLDSQGKDFFYRPSGTGPFKFAYWLRDSRLRIIGVRLERNENYYGPKSHLEAIEFSATFTLDQFLEREVDIIPYYSPSLSRTECQVLESDSFQLLYLGFSCHRSPFDNPLVRKAVALAIDKRHLARAYFTFETMPQVLNNIIHPRLPGFFPVEAKEDRNINEARSLMAKAGYIFTSTPGPIDFCLLKRDRRRGERIYWLLKEQLAEIGLDIRIRIINSYKNVQSLKNPYLVFLSWTIDFPDPENIIRPLFSLNAEINQLLFHYKSEAVETLLALSEKEKSWGKRNEIFRQIEAQLLEDLPVIPLFFLHQRLAVQRYVRGIKVPALGFSLMDMSLIWKEETR